MTDVSPSDFAVVIYRDDDVWEAEVLPAALTGNLDGLILALRQQPGIGGTIGLAAVGDDFFVAMRVLGSQISIFLSDVTASVDWPLARQVLDYLDIPVPEDEDLDQVLPVGTCRSLLTWVSTRWNSARYPVTWTSSRTRCWQAWPGGLDSAKRSSALSTRRSVPDLDTTL